MVKEVGWGSRWSGSMLLQSLYTISLGKIGGYLGGGITP